MDKQEKKYLNIQFNHTLNEYQRYFSTPLMKGKLKCYKHSELGKLDPNRQYWKIKNGNGEWCYYELPKYIKPFDKGSAHSLKRVSHRYCVRAALAIFMATAVWAVTSSFATRYVFQPIYPDDPVADLDELEKYIKTYQEFIKDNPGADVSKHFTPEEMANTAMGMALYNPKILSAGHYERRNMLVVSYGQTDTNAIIMVHVDIANAFIYQNQDTLEESISYSQNILAPKVGRRDFLKKDEVNSYPGIASSKTEATWTDKSDRHYSKKDYTEVVGKNPDSPFLYTVNKDSVLESSTARKIRNGYEININLDTIKGVNQYIKRIKYLSGKQASGFEYVQLKLIADQNMLLQKFSVNEAYLIDSLLPTTGELTATYYYDDVPPIPGLKDPFEYSKYPH